MAGLTTAGLEIKRLADIKVDLQAKIESELGTTIETGDSSVLGHLLGVMAAELAEPWELLGALYDSFSPDAANGRQLDNLAAVTGVTRRPATKAVGSVFCLGDEGTVIPAGKLVKASSSGLTFLITSTVTIPPGGSVSAPVESEEAGEAVVADIDQIVTPVPGWTGLGTSSSSEEGAPAESDGAFRIRRQQSLQIVGAAADNAIRSRILEVEGVLACAVKSNRALETVDGIPAKGFRVVVWPSPLSTAIETAIAEVIWTVQPAGIESSGAELFTVEDSQGFSQIVKFDYADPIELFIEATISTNAKYPSDGDAQVIAAIQAVFDGLAAEDVVTAQDQALLGVVGEGLSVGDDVTLLKLICAVGTVPGVVAASFKVDSIDPPVATTDFIIADDEIAQLGEATVA